MFQFLIKARRYSYSLCFICSNASASRSSILWSICDWASTRVYYTASSISFFATVYIPLMPSWPSPQLLLYFPTHHSIPLHASASIPPLLSPSLRHAAASILITAVPILGFSPPSLPRSDDIWSRLLNTLEEEWFANCFPGTAIFLPYLFALVAIGCEHWGRGLLPCYYCRDAVVAGCRDGGGTMTATGSCCLIPPL